MVVKHLIFFALSLLWVSEISAQKINLKPKIDSTNHELEALNVHGFSNQKFMVGLFVLQLDSLQIANNQFLTTNDFLQYQFPIAFKTYGTGEATSIAFRGTSPNHTAVLWNGININSPTLGQTDFSTISLSNFDKISVQFGAAGSTIGTGAVGGTISLNSNFSTLNSPISFGFRLASFQNYASNFKSFISKKISNEWYFSSKTQINWLQSNNQIPYNSLGNYPIEKIYSNQKSLTQDLFFLKNNEKMFSFNLWLTENQALINPKNINAQTSTVTNSYRFLVNYDYRNTNLSAGFIRDILDYAIGDLSNPDHSNTDRLLIKATQEISLNNQMELKKRNYLKIGGEISDYFAKVNGYGTDTFTELRGDIFALFRVKFNAHFLTSANARQSFTTGFNAPFTPSIGFEYKVFETDRAASGLSQIKLTTNVGKGFRVPTLNERFWLKLGNPLLKPESSLNKEIGIVLNSNHNIALQSIFSLNFYHNLIDNWTYWNPDNNYHVENLLQVLTKGGEAFYNVKFSTKTLESKLQLSYAYTHTSQQNFYNSFSADLIGKQMPYVPIHTFGANASFVTKKWQFLIQNLYYSERFVNADNSGFTFPAYYLLNANYSRSFSIFHTATNIVFQGNNLTNTVYPNLKKFAMPGRNFAISIHFKI